MSGPTVKVEVTSDDESDSTKSSTTTSASTSTSQPPPPNPKPKKKRKKMPQPIVGSLSAFDPKRDDLEMWWATYENFLVANDLSATSSEAKCVGILLSSIGIDTYTVLNTLLSPDAPSSKKLTELKSALVGHYKPAPKAIAERFRFTGRKQSNGETVHEFEAALRQLAIRCKFGAELENRVRDQFIFGLSSEAAQRQLFTKEDSIALKDVVNLASAQEAAEASTALVRGKAQQQHSGDQVHKVYNSSPKHGNNNKQRGNKSWGNNKFKSNKQTPQQQKTTKQSTPSAGGDSSTCQGCGSTDHSRSKCKFLHAKCHTCNKIGHISTVCRSQKGSTNHHLSLDSVSDMKMVRSSNKRLITLDVIINGQPHAMELDTGCETSVISEDFYKNQLCAQPPLTPSRHVFRTYTKETFKPVGDLSCTIHHDGQQFSTQIPVSCGSSLFGKDLLSVFQINWKNVESQCHRVVDHTTDLDSLLKQFEDVFQPPTSADRIKGYTARVILKDDATPRFLKARPIPYALRDKVDKELKLMESTGVITKVETSEWASPLVVVPKADGRVRITGDFKNTVNSQLCVTQYPLAIPDDIFANLAGCTTFSKLDGSNAYHQLQLDDSSKAFLVINTHRGLFRYNVLPQGIASSPAIFQAFMDALLKDVPHTGGFVDDAISGGTDATSHLAQLRTILERCRQHNYKLSRSKCQFTQPRIEFLGHIITPEGIQTSDRKVQAIKQIPQPQNVTEVKSFLGLVNFYGKFVDKLSSICEPLYNLTKKDVDFVWSTKCQQAFKNAKKMLSSAPTLTYYDPNKPIGVSCDASPVGLGVILFQKEENGFERPIAFASQLLSTTERNYSQIEKEGLAIIYGVKKFYKYLCGRRFILITDHKPLLTIFGPKSQLPPLVATRLHHWSLFLSQFTFDVTYRKSEDHGNADALSRLPSPEAPPPVNPYHESCVNYVATQQVELLPVTASQIRQATSKDPILSKVLQLVLFGWPPKLREEDSILKPFFTRRLELTINQGVLLWGIRVVISSNLQQRILHQLHEAHLGIVRMKALARQHVYWPGIDKSIEALCTSCVTCQQSAASPPSSPLHPWMFPEKPWQRLHMDLAGPYLNNMWLIVTDAHTKWPEVFLMNNNTTTSAVLQKLVELIARFGVPEQIVTDNGRQFISADFEAFCKENAIKHILSSPYHPRTNGEAERFVRTFKEAMKCSDLPPQLRLQRFLLAYRTTPHATTGVTPSELLQNRHLRTLLDLIHPDVSTTARKSQAAQEKSFNNKVKTREFHIQDSVWVKSYLKGEEKWTMGTIVGIIGPLTFNVKIGDRVLKRHSDQIRMASTSATHVQPSSDPEKAQPPLSSTPAAKSS